jgi:hypothetical protein
MRRPWGTKLPRKGLWALTLHGCWYFYRSLYEWCQPTRYVWRVWPDRPPRDWRYQVEKGRWDLKKPSSIESVGGIPLHHFLDPLLKKEYPRLYDALGSAAYEDGSRKGPGMLIVKPRGHGLSLTLKVEGSGLMIRCEGETWQAALKALDALLATDTPPWEDDPYTVSKVPKRKK